MRQNGYLLGITIASGLLAVCSAQANKGAAYQPVHKSESFPHNFTLVGGFNYLLAIDNGLPYATVTTGLTGPLARGEKYYLDPDYKFGYYLEAGYLINEVYDVQASWLQLNTNNTASLSGTGPGVVMGSSNEYNPFVVLASGQSYSAKTSETLNYQALDVTVGQYHDVGRSLNTRIFAGVRYASIVNDIKNTYLAANAYDGNPYEDTYNSTYNGAGPSFGVGAQYEIWETLSMVGEFTGAFLVGNLVATSDVAFAAGHNVDISTNDLTRIVPALDVKIGLHGGIPVWGYRDRFFIEGGYELAYYFSAVNELTASETVAAYSDNFADVSFSGPYMNFGAKF